MPNKKANQKTHDEKLIHLPSFLPYQLSILQQQVSDVVGSYYRQEYALTRNSWRVMAALALQGEASAKEVGNYVKLEKMPVSRAMKELTAFGYLQQKPDLEDRRIMRLSLTSAGMKCYRNIVPEVKKQEQNILEGLTEKERTQYAKLTQKLLAHVSELSND